MAGPVVPGLASDPGAGPARESASDIGGSMLPARAGTRCGTSCVTCYRAPWPSSCATRESGQCSRPALAGCPHAGVVRARRCRRDGLAALSGYRDDQRIAGGVSRTVARSNGQSVHRRGSGGGRILAGRPRPRPRHRHTKLAAADPMGLRRPRHRATGTDLRPRQPRISKGRGTLRIHTRSAATVTHPVQRTAPRLAAFQPTADRSRPIDRRDTANEGLPDRTQPFDRAYRTATQHRENTATCCWESQAQVTEA